MVCKWLSDEFSAICVNDNSPACGDTCPALNYYEICKYGEALECGTEKGKQRYAMIKMPDGSVAHGQCDEGYSRYNNGWMRVVINGAEYRCDQTRIVIWEE